jgi:hypothetical protein
MPEWYARRSEGIGQVNGVPAEQAEAVAVAWRMHDGQAHPAIRVGGVLMWDELAGPPRGPRREVGPRDEGVQLITSPSLDDEWYVDVVCIRPGVTTDSSYHVTDDTPTHRRRDGAYRMIDLDQLADAMSAASIDIARAAEASGARSVSSTGTHRGGPFPPPQIRGFFASDHRYPRCRAAGSDHGQAPPHGAGTR